MIRFSTFFVVAAFAAISHAEAAPLARTQLTLVSALNVDPARQTVTLPIYRGTSGGAPVWYIITDASDAAQAKHFGVNFSPSISGLGDAAVTHIEKNGNGFVFPGAPDFSQSRTYVTSQAGFPPKSASPGATASASYSPFVRVDGIGVLNAPIIATGNGPFDITKHTNTSDRVVAINIAKRTVTMVLARGFFNGKQVFYLSTEASDPVAASVERATYVPRLSKATGGEIPIGVVVDGKPPQGLDYLALHTPLAEDATSQNSSTIASSLNVLSLAPALAHPYEQNGYSPLWNVVVVGTKQSKELTTFADIAALSKPAGFVVNCPVVAYGP